MKTIKIVILLILSLTAGNANAQNKNLKRTEASGYVVFEDERGNVVETWAVDNEGALINNEQGYSIMRIKFDKNGNRIRQSRFDQNGSLVVDELGVAIWKFRYDKNNKMVYQGHFGVDRKLLPPNHDIVHSEWFWKYDKKGNLKASKKKDNR